MNTLQIIMREVVLPTLAILAFIVGAFVFFYARQVACIVAAFIVVTRLGLWPRVMAEMRRRT